MSDAKSLNSGTRPTMSLQQAKNTRMYMATKYASIPSAVRTVERIAAEPKGIEYLQWWQKKFEAEAGQWPADVVEAVSVFLKSPEAQAKAKVGTTWGQNERARDCGY